MVGRLDSFVQCARSMYDHWYELLPAYVLFACPGVDLDGVGKVAQVSVFGFGFVSRIRTSFLLLG